jgi:3-phosphoshikimate 1-carboxyvinyltransferase
MRLPEQVSVEGDWSGGAVFLCMGALSPLGIMVKGLSRSSVHGDRAVLDLVRGFGAEVWERDDAILIRRGTLRGQAIDASAIPDLIPALCAVAAAAEGESRILNAARLRLKESDRLSSITEMLRALGAEIIELPDGLIIRGKERLCGGTASCAADHRIAMAASGAAAVCTRPITIPDADCVEKSYPRFWEDFDALEGGNE